MSTSAVGFSNGLSVRLRQHVYGKRDRKIFDGVQAPLKYFQWYNAVDCNNRKSADYSTTICTNHSSTSVSCAEHSIELFTVRIHSCVQACHPRNWASQVEGMSQKQRTSLVSNWSCWWSIQLRLALDWNGDDNKRRSYMRKDVFTPCDYKHVAYFCKLDTQASCVV